MTGHRRACVILARRWPLADVISFARGAPSADLLPAASIWKAAEKALETDAVRALSYGTGIGHPELCAWLADRHGHGVSADRVMVTNGSLEAGWMLFNHLLSAGDSVVVEQPSYDRTLLMLEKLGVDRIGIGLEDDGIDVHGLEQALADGYSPKLVHIISNFHNPAGCTISEQKRRRLVELSAEHGFWIFEDDPYREVRFRRRRGAADDARARRGHRRQGGPRLLVLEDRRARRPRRLPDRPRRRDRRAREDRERDLHLAEHAGRVDRLRALPLRACSTRTSRRSTPRSRSAAPRSSPSSATRSPRPSSSSPRAATSSGRPSPRAPTPRRCCRSPRRRGRPSSPGPTS